MLLAAEHAAGECLQTINQARAVLYEFLVLQVHFLQRRCGPFVGVREVSQCLVIVLWLKQFLSFNSKGARNAQNFVRHAVVELQQVIEFFWRKEVPEDDFTSNGSTIGMIGGN